MFYKKTCDFVKAGQRGAFLIAKNPKWPSQGGKFEFVLAWLALACLHIQISRSYLAFVHL